MNTQQTPQDQRAQQEMETQLGEERPGTEQLVDSIALHTQANLKTSVFDDLDSFVAAQRMAKILAASTIIPATFQKNIPDCVIAIDLARRIGVNVFAVMKHLYVVHGKPAFEAKFIIACLNSCGMFSPIRYRLTGEGDNRTCVAWAKELATGEVLEGPPVSISIAKKEGWYGKNGSKWPTMTELMLRYRAASWFGGLYAPHITMGMQSTDEVRDTGSGGASSSYDAPDNAPMEMPKAIEKPSETKPTEADQPAETVAEVEKPTKQEKSNEPLVVASAIKIIKNKLGIKSIPEVEFCKQFEIKAIQELRMIDINKAMSWIEKT